MPNTNFQTVHQFGAGISQVVRQATGRDPVQNIDMEHVSVAWAKRLRVVDTYTGNPLTFTAEKAGIIGAEVGMWIKQNLNGQDYPWPAGCSSNMIPDGTDTTKGYIRGNIILNTGILAANNDAYVSEYFPVVAGDSYVLTSIRPVISPAVCFYDENKTYISGNNQNGAAFITITAPEGAAYARCSQYVPGGANLIQFERGTQPSTVVPYTNICPITPWESVLITVNDANHPTEFPQPVYIGSFNTLTGQLVITSGMATVSELSWSHEHVEDVSGGHERFNTPSLRDVMQHDSVAYRIPLSCSAYKAQFAVPPITPPFGIVDYSIWSGGGTINPIYITDNRFTTASAFKRAMGDTQIVYPLQNPIVLQLDKEEIPAVEGENVVSTNANTLTVTLYEAV